MAVECITVLTVQKYLELKIYGIQNGRALHVKPIDAQAIGTDLRHACVSAMLWVAWIGLGYLTLFTDWWSVIKMPLSQLSLADIGNLIWSAAWRLAVAGGLFWITVERLTAED